MVPIKIKSEYFINEFLFKYNNPSIKKATDKACL